jgi:hypothetical protein
MIRFVLLILLAVPGIAQAQFIQFPSTNSSPGTGREGEIIARPICSAIVNRSDQAILGTLSTAGQAMPSGDVIRHRDNFRLEAGDRREFCSTGPFYEGQRLEIVLRTIIPLFDCKTKIDRGDIYLDAIEDEYGVKKLSATCY